jgi:hypothetical protein
MLLLTNAEACAIDAAPEALHHAVRNCWRSETGVILFSYSSWKDKTSMRPTVAYIRVSKPKQGRSGLDLEAQRLSVSNLRRSSGAFQNQKSLEQLVQKAASLPNPISSVCRSCWINRLLNPLSGSVGLGLYHRLRGSRGRPMLLDEFCLVQRRRTACKPRCG